MIPVVHFALQLRGECKELPLECFGFLIHFEEVQKYRSECLVKEWEPEQRKSERKQELLIMNRGHLQSVLMLHGIVLIKNE